MATDRTDAVAPRGPETAIARQAATVARVVRVLIVDDHRIVRDGLRRLLEASPLIHVVGDVATFGECLATIGRSDPDVALIDVRLPGVSGIELVRALRAQHPGVRCIVLTGLSDESVVVESVVAGAAGYLSKAAEPQALIDAVMRVAAGTTLFDPAVIESMMDRVAEQRAVTVALDTLTPQEQNVVDLVARGYTNREIASELYLAEKTVRNYVSNVLGKVGLGNRTALAAAVTRMAVTGAVRTESGSR